MAVGSAQNQHGSLITVCNAHACGLYGTFLISLTRIVEATAAVVEDIVVPVIMGVAALSVVMPGRVGYIIVVAAANGVVIVSIVMSRFQRAVVAGFISDGQLVADFIYIKVINGHSVPAFDLN